MESAVALGVTFLDSVKAMFQSQKRLVEDAIRQLRDEQLHISLDTNTNTIAVMMKHMAGNMRSRWTDFLESDGEKPWRNRDDEFVDDILNRVDLMDRWEAGWQCLFDAVTQLSESDLLKIVKIRGYDHSVIEAIHRQIDHYGYHVGQIVQLARYLAKERWETLSIPRGESEAYNRRVWNS